MRAYVAEPAMATSNTSTTRYWALFVASLAMLFFEFMGLAVRPLRLNEI